MDAPAWRFRSSLHPLDTMQQLSELSTAPSHPRRLAVLDGWRGISISLVLAAHLLPLGPKSWELNEMAARLGMALFFTLSGFLITSVLLRDTSVKNFLIRRILRIVPLAWLAMAIYFPLSGTDPSVYIPNFLFFANLPPIRLATASSHLWSLCVEMQFYLVVAILVLVLRVRGLFVIAALSVAVTLLRVREVAYVDIVTWRRVDEILAGVILALVYARRPGGGAAKGYGLFYVFVGLAIVSSHPSSGPVNYFRPYIVAALVGTTLYALPSAIRPILLSRALAYLATISFALYVIHGMLQTSWIGSGEQLVKYAKRPFLFGLTFALAHVSTFYYEAYWIGLGKRLTDPRRGPGHRAMAPSAPGHVEKV